MATKLINGVIPQGDVPDFLKGGVVKTILSLDDDRKKRLLRSTMPVGNIDVLVLQDVRNMIATLRGTVNPATGRPGLALANNQIGGHSNIAIIDTQRPEFEGSWPNFGPGIMVLVNPQVVQPGEENSLFLEKCLSMQGLELNLQRPTEIVLGFQNLDGDYIEAPMGALVSRASQHELDHLGGLTILDHFESQLKDAAHLKKLDQVSRQAENNGLNVIERASLSTMLSSGHMTMQGVIDLIAGMDLKAA